MTMKADQNFLVDF